MNVEGTQLSNPNDQQRDGENNSRSHSRNNSHDWLSNIEIAAQQDNTTMGVVRRMSQRVLSQIYRPETTHSENMQQEPFYKRIFKSTETDTAQVRELFEKIKRL